MADNYLEINTNNTRREKQLGKESASTERKEVCASPSSSAAQRRGSCVRSGRRQQLPLHQYRQRQSNRRLTSTCCTISTPPSQAYPYRRSSLFLLLYTSSTLRDCRERGAGLSCLAGRMERRAGARQDVRRIGRKTQEGKLGYLAAFSGILAGKNMHPFFVPPVYDLLQPQGFFKKRKSKYRRSMPASGSWKRMKHTGGNSNNYLPCNKPPGMLWKMPKHR